ncbi:hypothetical protein [Collimonas sp.]|jgi:hypothetical protein|uniref:hypothetical protein n=1 Tax=Collimonas sp. TaxID=1963772 RepID=UPI002BB122E8|nr:hypothetical protein [Collimonas sp.]HWW05979.1 hypothetical protein [Collimonas sp.]
MKTADIALAEQSGAPQAERRQPKAAMQPKNRGQAGSEKPALPDACIGQDECIVAAAEVIVAMTDEVLTPLTASHARHRSAASSNALLLSLDSGGNSTSGDETIIGSGDRAHHLAMIAITATPPLRRAAPEKPRSLPSLRPSSRAECGRRCGADGFCDPSSEFGCGGEYCVHLHESLY